MNGALLFRKSFTRPIAAGLTVVLLALSVAAGFHQGDHSALGWLPERFHKHDFRWAAEADGAKARQVDDCLACHLGRTLVRLAPPAPVLPEAPAPVFAGAPQPAAQTPSRTDFPRAPRAPPAS